MGRTALNKRGARKSVAAAIADRTDAIAQMNSRLERKFRKLSNQINDLQADNIRYYYKIGEVLRDVKEDPAKYMGQDGTPGIKLIERALSTHSRTLRHARKFANDCDAEEVDALIALAHPETGFRLNWGHIMYLLTTGTPERRMQYGEEAVQKMLDPRALHDLIKKRLKRTGGHGRKHEMPKTIPAQIKQILTICRQWVTKNNEIWNGEAESIFGNILNMPPAEMEPDMVAQLEEIESLMREISADAETNVATAQRVREYLAETIEQRDAHLADAVESTGRAARNIELG